MHKKSSENVHFFETKNIQRNMLSSQYDNMYFYIHFWDIVGKRLEIIQKCYIDAFNNEKIFVYLSQLYAGLYRCIYQGTLVFTSDKCTF